MGHEISMKKEDIFFMSHESKSCLFYERWKFHETRGYIFMTRESKTSNECGNALETATIDVQCK